MYKGQGNVFVSTYEMDGHNIAWNAAVGESFLGKTVQKRWCQDLPLAILAAVKVLKKNEKVDYF